MPYRVIQTEIGDLISVVVQVGRDQTGQRRVMEVFEVESFDPDGARYEGNTFCAYDRNDNGST